MAKRQRPNQPVQLWENLTSNPHPLPPTPYPLPPTPPQTNIKYQVITDVKPRFSISGWYHAPAEPQGREAASLQQLQMAPGQDCVRDHAGFDGGPADSDLTQEDLDFLNEWVNPVYLEPKAWEKVSGKSHQPKT